MGESVFFKALVCALVFVIFSSFATAEQGNVICPAKGVVVLVPGTFNSLIPGGIDRALSRNRVVYNPYFSETILQAFRDQGYGVLVIQGLAPFGDLESNGHRTLAVVEDWYRSNCQENKAALFFVGHSAGAFYALKAIEQNKNLPIKKLLMLAAPLQGSRLADGIFNSIFLRGWFEVLLQSTSVIFDTRGLVQMQSRHIKNYLNKIRLPTDVELYSAYGYQASPPLSEMFSAEYLSPFFSAIDVYLGMDSDGALETSSAQGQGLVLLDQSGLAKPINLLPDIINLEHTEQFLDYRIFQFLGIYHTEYIRDEQYRFYSNLSRFL